MYLCSPEIKPSGLFMSENNIVNPNAEVTGAYCSHGRSYSDNKCTCRQTLNACRALVCTAQTAHDDFDWSIDKRNVTAYTKEEKEKYDKVYEDTFKAVTDGELVKGSGCCSYQNRCCYQHRF